jgi:hypothetical protein
MAEITFDSRYPKAKFLINSSGELSIGEGTQNKDMSQFWVYETSLI